MNWDEIYQLVSRWYATGLLAESDKPAIQAAYTSLTGDPGERCRTCSSYWYDVQHALRYHLIIELGYDRMDNNNEYMIIRSAGYIQVNGLSYAYINKGEGVESESARFLTDEIAKNLLAENPDRSAVIVPNPDYNPDKADKSKEKVADAKPKADAAKAKVTGKGKGKTATAPAPEPTPDPAVPDIPVVDPVLTNPTVPAEVVNESGAENDPAKTEESQDPIINS